MIQLNLIKFCFVFSEVWLKRLSSTMNIAENNSENCKKKMKYIILQFNETCKFEQIMSVSYVVIDIL
jgi:hypothetical protein